MNNSRFKFRVWDRETKRYLDGTERFGISISLDTLIFALVDGKIDHEINTDSFVLEQFTGLYDCEGKEIFEGDILGHKVKGDISSILNDNLDFSWLYVVKFFAGAFHVVFVPAKKDYGRLIEWRHCQVIGNRFENSELLEVKE